MSLILLVSKTKDDTNKFLNSDKFVFSVTIIILFASTIWISSVSA